MVAVARLECHVGGKTLGRSQARPFADEQDHDTGRKHFADLIDQAHTAVAHDEWVA